MSACLLICMEPPKEERRRSPQRKRPSLMRLGLGGRGRGAPDVGTSHEQGHGKGGRGGFKGSEGGGAQMCARQSPTPPPRHCPGPPPPAPARPSPPPPPLSPR